MHLSILSTAIFAGLAAAQFAGLPTCAQDCASQQFSGGSYAGCGTDPKCICSNQDFLSNIACCLIGACDQADQTSAIVFATQICSAQGVTVPTVVSCSTATGAALGPTGAATAASTSATATGTPSAPSASGAAPTATGAASSGATAAAWAPRQTAAVGLEMLGLAVAGAGMVLF